MKNKNVLLTAIVTLAAFGSSIASVFLIPTATWISGTKFVTGAPAVATCSTIGSVCNASGTTPNCQVIVTLRSTATKPTIAYTDNTCLVPLKSNSAVNYTPPTTSFTDVRDYAAN